MKFGTVIADPPWPYARIPVTKSRRGYITNQYKALSIADLISLDVKSHIADTAVLFLWCTWPFIAAALECIAAWGFTYKTGFPWVKITEAHIGKEVAFKPAYGVGYWLRGCSELVLIGAKGNAAVRTNFIGLLCEGAKHSRKPDSIYEIAEKCPGPYLELFARRERCAWVSLGDDPALTYSGDIRTTLPFLEVL